MAKIMLIRHAEKPGPGGPDGVDENGQVDAASLTPLGWQRAVALAALFGPGGGPLPAGLAVPDVIFASCPGRGSRSKRPLQTVSPLAEVLGCAVDQRFGVGEIAGLAEAAAGCLGMVLISWQHEAIPAIVQALGPVRGGVPASWPGARFDLVWVLDGSAAGWVFSQVGQMVLAGDAAP